MPSRVPTRSHHTRDVSKIVDEFLEDDQPYAVFIDNNLGSRPEYPRELCRALRPLEKIWSAAVSIDVTDDPSLVREMALAGCTDVFVGFESLSDRNIDDAGKRSPRVKDYAARVVLLHDYGIQVNGSFVLGFDHDTAHVVFRPKKMSEEELASGYEQCYRRLFSHRSIWRRRPSDWSAVPAYLAMSYLYKRSNRFWHMLIRRRLTARVWRPLVELTRRRHVGFRARIAEIDAPAAERRADALISAGVQPATAFPICPTRPTGTAPR